MTELGQVGDLRLVQSVPAVERISKLVSRKPGEPDCGQQIVARVSIDSSIYEKLAVYMCSHFQTTLGPIVRENKPVSFQDFALSRGLWPCHHCEASSAEGQVQCGGCHTFRNIDTFQNIVYSPGDVTEQEMVLFSKRRLLEKRMICGRDLITSEKLRTDECWYIISADWLKEWKAYIFNRPSGKSVVSPNREIGVLPPGPITNVALLLPDGKTPRPGLQKVLPFL